MARGTTFPKDEATDRNKKKPVTRGGVEVAREAREAQEIPEAE